MREKTTEERRGVYIVTTPDDREHKAVRAGYRAMMQRLRERFPGAQLSVRFEEVHAVASGEIIALEGQCETFVKVAS